jgi:DNA-binding NtrC family response regulator
LQERELERVGGNRTIKVDVRVIATTNRRLEESVEKKEFRQDLFFRLNVVPIHLAPLREHSEDVPLLAAEFMRRLSRKHGTQVHGFTREALELLKAHQWPGNVRELQNVVERAIILCDGQHQLGPEHLGLGVSSQPAAAISTPASALTGVATSSETNGNGLLTLAELEKQHIFATLRHCNGNRTHAAKMLNISIRTMRNKLHEYNGTAANGESELEVLAEA